MDSSSSPPEVSPERSSGEKIHGPQDNEHVKSETPMTERSRRDTRIMAYTRPRDTAPKDLHGGDAGRGWEGKTQWCGRRGCSVTRAALRYRGGGGVDGDVSRASATPRARAPSRNFENGVRTYMNLL